MLKLGIVHYIIHPIDEEYLYYTIQNVLNLIYINRRVSPLTGLPGNVQIQAELKKRLLKKEAFEILYFDLDNFKSYNDKYGFLSGDEIIKFTAQTIVQNITCECPEDCFIGHIGGDDFVAIISSNKYEEICQNIKLSGADTAYIYASNCLGLCFYPTKIGIQHHAATQTEYPAIFKHTYGKGEVLYSAGVFDCDGAEIPYTVENGVLNIQTSLGLFKMVFVELA
jgi:diguanylate cyclase (GGDEF)-like protein